MSVLPEDMGAYQALQGRVDRRMTALGRGSNSRASYALEMSPTTVSRVRRGIEINQPVLENLDTWSINEASRQSSVLQTAV